MNKLNIAVVGCRHFTDYEKLRGVMDDFIDIHKDKDICIVSGGARGADSLAEKYASEKGYEFKCFPADWDTHGKIAGFIRNKDIVDAADTIVAFWDGKSTGTKDTLEKARRAGVHDYICGIDGYVDRRWTT